MKRSRRQASLQPPLVLATAAVRWPDLEVLREGDVCFGKVVVDWYEMAHDMICGVAIAIFEDGYHQYMSKG